MKRFKKILLIVGITMLLAVIGVGSVSAKTYMPKPHSSVSGEVYTVSDIYENYDVDDIASGRFVVIEPNDINIKLYDCKVVFIEDEILLNNVTEHSLLMINYLIENWDLYGRNAELNCENIYSLFDYYSSSYAYSPKYDEETGSQLNSYDRISDDFGMFVEFELARLKSCNSDTTYFDLIKEQFAVDEYYPLTFGISLDSSLTFTSGYVNDVFKSAIDDCILNREFSLLEKNNSTLANQVTNLNSIITEKDSIITEKNTAISNLESQNNKLEMNVAGLNSQVSALVEDRTELNAQIKSLENQMQLKINKAYAEGLVDSDGEGNRVNKLISTLVIISIVLEVVALIAFVVSKARKNKHR